MINTGTMKIQDTTGISFFNYLSSLMQDKLKSTQASSFFLMSIIFIGHKDDGTTETVSTCFFPFSILRFGFNFTSSGSVYDVTFLPLEGGSSATKYGHQLENRNDVSTVTTQGNAKTIGGLLNSLESQLNTKSIEVFSKYSSNTDGIKKPGKLVQYMITLPDEWKDFEPDLAAASVNSEQRFVSRGTGTQQRKKLVADVQVSFSESMGITDAVKMILETSTAFMEQSSTEKLKNGDAISYRCVRMITSDESTFIVHYDIFPVKAHSSEKVKANKINLIEYDYIFTGFNSHIHDLKIEYQPEVAAAALDGNFRVGRNRSAELAAQGQKTSDVKKEAKSDAKKTEEKEVLVRENDPIFKGMKTAAQRDNTADHFNEDSGTDGGRVSVKARQEYSNTMASLHFVKSLQLDMVIRGNPNLMRKFSDAKSRGGLAPHFPIVYAREIPALLSSGKLESAVKSGFASSKEAYVRQYVAPKIKSAGAFNKSGDPVMSGPDITVCGLYAKINIKAPNIDFVGDQGGVGNYVTSGPMFTDSMFYDGLYLVLRMTSSFNGGEFQQHLTMIASPTEDFNEKAKK
jgi:hypothetical protein